MKRLLSIVLLFSLVSGAPSMAAQSTSEFTITARNVSKLPLWYRIKHALQTQVDRAFNNKKTLKDLTQHGNVVVKFYRPGCKYCVHIDPLIEQIKSEFAHDVTFINVNLDAQTREYKSIYSFDTVPTVIYFKNGKEVLRHGSNNGTITKDEIKSNIESAFIKKHHAHRAKNLTDQTVVAHPKASKANHTTKLNQKERACIEMLITLAQAHITELSTQLHAFFDTKGNKDPYRIHVEKFYEILMKVDKSITSPLKAAIKSTKNNEYKNVLTLMQDIVQDLHKNLFDAHAAFKNNEGKDPLVAALALGDLKKDAEVRRPQIEGKLKTIHAELLKLDPDLAHQIDALHKSLPKIFESELSNLVLLNRLKQRLSMK